MPVLTAQERVGTTLAGKYRLDRILGRGGFGVVYAGEHTWTGRPIAVKILSHELSERGDHAKRFLREARAAARLEHANVVDVLDMGNEPDGTVYLVLELLRGETLAQKLEREGALEASETLDILSPIMDALQEAHTLGIVHRDLKPDNIILSIDNKRRIVPKLLDFGIAKVDGAGQTATETGVVMGTPQFMAPEQARGLPDVGAAADVWSMGVITWLCATGTLPFNATTNNGLIAEILTTRAAPIASIAPTLAGPFAEAIDRALIREPDQRHASMHALHSALLLAAGYVPPVDSSEIALPEATGRISTGTLAMSPNETPPGDAQSAPVAPTLRMPSPLEEAEAVASVTPTEMNVAKTIHTPLSYQERTQPKGRRERPVMLIAGAAGLALAVGVVGIVVAVVVGGSSEDSPAAADRSMTEPPEPPESIEPESIEPEVAEPEEPTPAQIQPTTAVVAAAAPEPSPTPAPEVQPAAAVERPVPERTPRARPRPSPARTIQPRPLQRTASPAPTPAPVRRPVRSRTDSMGVNEAPILR